MAGEPSHRKRGRPPHPDILTPREWQVLDLLRQGLTNEQIAQRLDISFATAKYHVAVMVPHMHHLCMVEYDA
jgi:DNA-binding NarL/FixJ family response regulator